MGSSSPQATRNNMPQRQSGNYCGWNSEPEIALERGLLAPDFQHEPRPKKLMYTVCAICAATLISGCVVWFIRNELHSGWHETG
jgi:hypothetical protein